MKCVQSFRLFCFVSTLLAGLPAAQAEDQVIISEFMASNTRTLRDETGAFEDWIEVQNIGTNTVNLDGWYLTDDDQDLTQWRFPATNLNAGAVLVVFASNNDRRVAGATLHTNFRLSTGGEFLALVKPDGVTLASVFQFPQQAPDVSYGFGLLTTNQTLISSNSAVRVRVPPDGSDGTNWTTLGFDDQSWIAGTNGVGYGPTNVVLADYGAAVAPTAPVGYWRLNETTGTTATNIGSGAGLNGTYNTVTLGTAGPPPAQFPGFEANNTAPTFNGSSSYVSGPLSLLSSRSTFTIAGWIKLASTPVARTGLFGQNDCVEFGFSAPDMLQCWTPNGATTVAHSFVPGTWYHILAVADGSTIRLYTNAVLMGSAASTANASSSFNFNIGGGGIFDTLAANGNWFPGQIDEVVVYHRALSAAEILSLYSAGTNAMGGTVANFIKTDVRAAMSNVNASAYIRLPFVVDDPANISLLTLRMRYDDGFVAFLNGIEAVRVNATDPLNYNSNATNSHSPLGVEEFRLGTLGLQSGSNMLAIQGLNLATNDADFLILAELIAASTESASTNPVYFTTPSPGAPNGAGVPNPGPAIVDAAHTPNVPRDSENLTVTARVLPTFGPVASVALRYRVMFGAEVETPMLDDGLHGDGAAGDHVFGASIPDSASTNGQMIRWLIRATDSMSRTSRWPLFASADSEEYLGTIVDPTNVTSKLPIIHLFATSTALQPGPTTGQSGGDSQTGARVAIFHDGEFYDNVSINLRGNTTSAFNKKSHHVNFNREHTFHLSSLNGRVRHTSFMADYIDPTYMRQGLSFWLAGQMGAPEPFYNPVRLQLNGQFYQLANHNDTVGAEQIERFGYDPEGALYKAAGVVVPGQVSTGNFEKKTRLTENNADYLALANGIAEGLAVGQRRTNLFDLLDLPEVINYLVTARWGHENDDVWANMTLYRDTLGDGLWRLIPFDMNLSWGAIYYEGAPASMVDGVQSTNDTHKAHPLYGSSSALALSGGPAAPNNYNRVYDVIFQVPETRQMFLRRLRTLLDTYVKPIGTPTNSTMAEQLILARRDLIAEEARMDRLWWGWQAKGGQNNFDPPANAGAFGSADRTNAATVALTNGVDAMLNDFFLKRRTHFYAKHSITNTALAIGIGKDQNAGIPLTQPAQGFVTIAGAEFNPASGNQAEEFICVTNPTSFALDLSGWKLEGAVAFTFRPGTVMPSNSVIYISPDVKAFRARSLSPRGGQGLFVVGPYSGQLSARGEMVSVRDNNGRLVSTFSYAGAPSPAQQYLRITELMYHPAPTNSGPYTADDFEFIELKNIGPSTLSLTGVRFTNGVIFSFTGSAVTSLASSQSVLVVRNQAAFTARYGGGFTIAGQYQGLLDNNGERIQLLDASNEEILDFSYDHGWYPTTDGLGFSLVVVDANATPDAWGTKPQWRPSGQPNGSPGSEEPGPVAIAPILISEVLSHTELPAVDYIEVYNPTTNDVNIGGWYLSDDFNTPKKFRIPNGKTIGAGSYEAFYEPQFNPTPGMPPSFALSADGDEVWLFSADLAGNLTGYFHGFGFGGAEAGVSFGRHVTSDSKEHFVAQIGQTPGTNNSGPSVGPIVFSEVMYHPPDVGGTNDNSADEFVELLNITMSPVNLWLSSAPSNTWKVTGGVDYDFPTNVTLAAGEYALLVNFDPADTALLGAFQMKYGVAPGVKTFGPYNGKLDNGGEDIALQKPTVQRVTNVFYALVEKVSYADQVPWPGGADGFGLSLQRSNTAAFGNDPANWIAALPTPALPRPASGTPPSILTPPASQSALAGTNLTLSVSAAGDAPLRYQWRHDGSILAGATNATLPLLNVQAQAGGDYDVLVYNAAGSVLSSNAVLQIVYGASILQHPQAVSVFPLSNATFSVQAFSGSAIGYQWRFNGLDINGATNGTYTLTNAQPVNDGNYSVRLSDSTGTALSDVARLTVITHPLFTNQAASRVVILPPNTNTIFTALAFSSTPVRYQWRFFGTNLTRGTNASLTVSNVVSLNEGPYDVVATDNYGSITSVTALLTVLIKPTITLQPVTNVTAVAGGSVTFTIAASGSLPMSYRWRKGGSSLTNIIVPQNYSSLTLTNLGPADATTYNVAVTNLAGQSTPALSSTITLTLLSDTDHDGLPDDWETSHPGFNINDPADGARDDDHDGMSNAAEYIAGTDYLDPTSYLRAEIAAGGSALVSFMAVSNRTYSVQYSDGITPPTWLRLGDVLARTNTRPEVLIDPNPGSNRFYRLAIPIQR